MGGLPQIAERKQALSSSVPKVREPAAGGRGATVTSSARRLAPEMARLESQRSGAENWRLWGPYLAERAWGTVREDYSPEGEVWGSLSHDQARSRAYRWSEDGLGGICDDQQRLCFALALWNGRDRILKERAFGLTGDQGNRGEDVKEYYFYRDATPSHSWLNFLYKYPQCAFPYDGLVEENARRSRLDPPFNLLDAGAFHENRYFDAEVLYAKAGADEIHIRIVAVNRGPKPLNCISCRPSGFAIRGRGAAMR